MQPTVHEFEYNPRSPVTPGCSFLEIARPDAPFRCEKGGVLRNAVIAYETWGESDASRPNTIWICPSLSVSSHVAESARNRDEGWWDKLVGPGKAVDTARWFVVCSNLLGGCYGSTGPASTDPGTGVHYGTEFPELTIRDLVHAQKKLMDGLGIRRLRAVIGGSMGGMQVLEWGRLYSNAMDLLIPIAAGAAASPRSIALRSIQRDIVRSDPDWRDGNYYDSGPPVRGMSLARKLGMVTYRSYEEFWERFGRNRKEYRFEIEHYLEHVAQKFAHSFDTNSYLTLSHAMDSHDLADGMTGCDYRQRLDSGIRAVKPPSLIVSMRNDELFPPVEQQYLHRVRVEAGLPGKLQEIPVVTGHDGFLAEAELMQDAISNFLNNGL
ncbi:MAG TPA: homoserine O-acetyltransferase [Acidobacteriota bacterium]|jgi:homoserine O-acetyltransferase